MKTRVTRFVTILAACLLAPLAAVAQTRGEASAHVALAAGGEFDGSDVGVGGRVGFRPWRPLGLEAEITLYPEDYPDGAPFSQSRWEGFFGATFGPRLGRTRVFARLRPGFLRYQEAGAPIACIAIFPPPLSCTLASGATVMALDVGGGVDVDISPRTYLRLDAGDRLLRYEGPAFRGRRAVMNDDLWVHGVRVAVAGGVRF